MSMVKEELRNTVRLTKLKLKNSKRNFLWFLGLIVFLILFHLLPLLINLTKGDSTTLAPYSFQDFSMSIFFGLCIGQLVFAFTYRQNNGYYSVFPQTNTSRFGSSMLFFYFCSFVGGVSALLIYLIEYGTLRILSHFRASIHLALKFDLLFLITGLFTFLMYMFIITATVGLISSIFRKWRLYTAAVFFLITIFLVVSGAWVTPYIQKAVFFFTQESSIPIFFAKGLLTWVLLTILSLVVNRYTVYYQSVRISQIHPLLGVVALIIAMGVIVPAILFTNITSSSSTTSTSDLPSKEYDQGCKELSIDVSHLPRGSKITLESETVVLPNQAETNQGRDGHSMFVLGCDGLESLKGDTLTIRYKFPSHKMDGIETYDYANQRLLVNLDGTTLHLDYQLDPCSIIILPIFGFAGQFEQFQNQCLLTKYPFGYSSSVNSGDINISVN